MMKMNDIPVATAKKALSVWTGKDFLYTENFPEFLHEISSNARMIPSIHGMDYFLVYEENIPFPQIHGMFKNWDDLLQVAKLIGKSFHIITHFCPSAKQASDIDPGLLYVWTGSSENKESTSLGDISLEEAANFIMASSPELYNELFISLIRDSLNENLYTIIRDQNGKIIFLHMVRKMDKAYDGVYLWSSLPFGETVKAFKRSLDRLAIGRLSSLILKSNERSLAFHKFLGFQFNGINSYRLRFDAP